MRDQLSLFPEPPPIEFERDVSFPDTMGGARRKPAPPIGGPAVTSHRAFWFPRQLVSDRDASITQVPDRDAWIKQIEKFILALYHHLQDQSAKDEGLRPRTRSFQRSDNELHLLDNAYSITDAMGAHPRPIRTHPSRYQMFRLRFAYGLAPVTMSLELHDEFFTLSTIIDLAWKVDEDAAKKPGIAEHRAAIAKLKTAIEDLNTAAATHYRLAKQNDSERIKDDTRRDLRKPYAEIYEKGGIWDTFFSHIFATPYDQVDRKKLGKVSTDLRGFVASVGEPRRHTGVFGNFQPFAAWAGDGTFIGGPGSFVKRDSAALRIGDAVFEDVEAVHYVDTLLPWLKADKGFVPKDSDKEADRTEPVEFTFTQVADRRAIFASALGAQLSRQRGDQEALTYVMIARNQARWQLGRLVDYFHMLATSYQAALYDHPLILKAGERLDEFERKLDVTENLPAELFRIGQRPDNESPETIAGGLVYRVARSCEYRRRGDEFVELLRHRRIEGFPPYPETMRRRVGGIFDEIEAIGAHFADVQEKVTGVNRQAVATELLILQRRLATQTTLIKGFQKLAEVAVFLGLFPDAVSNLVIKVLGEHSIWKDISIAATGSLGLGIILREPLLEERKELRKVGFRSYARELVTKRVPKKLRWDQAKALTRKTRRKLYWRIARKRVLVRREWRRAITLDTIAPGM